MTAKNNKVIYENDNYIVEVTEGDDGLTYQARNKYTNVVERTDSVWPSVVSAAKFFDQQIKDIEMEGDTEIAEVFPLSIN